jgi:hypothetical protein
MLVLVIFYLIWKARARLRCSSRSSSTGSANARVSGAKFDLDYWLKQVDILEAKEAERHRTGQSPYLELPINIGACCNTDGSKIYFVQQARHR